MIASDRNLFFTAPHLIFFPGIAITLTVLAFNLIGDGLRDALDPQAQPMTDERTPARADAATETLLDPSVEGNGHRGARPGIEAAPEARTRRRSRSSRSRACGRRSTRATGTSAPSTASTSTSTAARSWASSANPAAARA